MVFLLHFLPHHRKKWGKSLDSPKKSVFLRPKIENPALALTKGQPGLPTKITSSCIGLSNWPQNSKMPPGPHQRTNLSTMPCAPARQWKWWRICKNLKMRAKSMKPSKTYGLTIRPKKTFFSTKTNTKLRLHFEYKRPRKKFLHSDGISCVGILFSSYRAGN